MNNLNVPIDGSAHETKKKPELEETPGRVRRRDRALFSWTRVGFWNDESNADKTQMLKLTKVIQTYVLEHFYSDWYWNCSLIVGTCFFSWLVARLRWGFLGLGFVLLFTNSVYRTELRRFNRNIRDDMSRVQASNRLENELETMEWLNSFMDKFWVIYMPAFSEMVMFQANEVLKDQAPGFGIEALSLDEFTLGSKAPRVNSIKSYTRKGHDHIEMDWNFLFAPNDTDDMTKNEIKKKINPKVALGVTIGKAFILKSLPILVEDMSFTGRMNIKLKLTQNFPHVKMVSVQFLEAPTIDYALKPVGGDTLGIDIMSFIPGLSKFVNSLIHSNLRPMMYAPNSLDIDVEAIMAAQSNDLTGVLAVSIKRCSNLKTGNPTAPNSINPYVQLKIANNPELTESTKVKKLVNDPIFLETKYLLVNLLENNHLLLNVFHLLKDKAEDQLIGNVDFPLTDMLQESQQSGLVKNITEGGRVVGNIEFDLRWYPELPPIELDDGTKEPNTDSEVGILKVNLHEARDLDISQSPIGSLNPYAEIFINYELVKSCRCLRQTNEPLWEQSLETLITEKSNTRVQVYVKDAVEQNIVGKLDVNLQDLVFESSRGQQWITLQPLDNAKPGTPPARFRITAGWKALSMLEDSGVQNFAPAPIGGLKLQIRGAKGLKNLEAVGKVDPYVRVIVNGKVQGKTPTIANSLNPNWDRNFYLPVTNEHQHYLLEIMDEEEETNDRSLGTAAVAIHDFLKKDLNGYYQAYDGLEEIIEQPIILDTKEHGTMTYSVVFIPAVPVFTNNQLLYRDQYEQSLREAEQKEAEKKAEEEKLYNENPNEYEWVVTDKDELPVPPKREIALSKLAQFKAGIMTVSIHLGHFDKSDVYVHTLFDDSAYPCGISQKSEGKILNTVSHGEGFVRDLEHSLLVLRILDLMEVVREKQILAEKTFNTADILQKAKNSPITLKIDNKNWVKVQVDFAPIDVVLAPADTVLDVGLVRLDILSAENLRSVDSNGKSDPLLCVKLDGVEVYKTDKKRRTLDPVWNEEVEFPMTSRSTDVLLVEVYDWDLTHDDELLGRARLDLTGVNAYDSTPFAVELDTQGTVKLRATFKPQFIRPKLGASGLNIDLGAVSGVPLKAVSGVGNVAGMVGGSASDTVTKGTGFFKGLTKKSKTQKKNKAQQQEQLGGLQPGEFNDDASTAPTESDDFDGGESLGPQSSNFDATSSGTSTRHGKLGRHHNGGPVVGVPNINIDELPPPQRPMASGLVHMGHQGQLNGNQVFMGHARSALGMTDVLSFAPLTHGSDAVAGRVTIVSADNFSDSNALGVKVVLKTSSKEKDIFKTRPTKSDKESSMYRWNESVPFRSAVTGELRFYIREHHTFGKDVEIAQAVVPLSEVAHKHDNITLNAGNGNLVVNVRYLP